MDTRDMIFFCLADDQCESEVVGEDWKSSHSKRCSEINNFFCGVIGLRSDLKQKVQDIEAESRISSTNTNVIGVKTTLLATILRIDMIMDDLRL